MNGCWRKSSRSSVKILIVEDDAPTLELLALFLGRFYAVVECADGGSALAALSADSDIALIVTDLRMPGVTGYHILRRADEIARQTGRTIPTIVLTGHGTPEDEAEARGLGVTCFQRKPIDLKVLRKTIDKYLLGSEI